MRGIGRFRETLGSQICPSCLWRIASQNGSGGPPRLPLEFVRSISTPPRRPSSRIKRNHGQRWRNGSSRAAHGSAMPNLPNNEAFEFDAPGAGQNIDNRHRDSLASNGLAENNASRYIDIPAILEEGQPGRIMAGLTRSDEFKRAIQDLPEATFVEVLRLLSPDYFVEPNKEIHSSLHPTTAYLNTRTLPLSIIVARFAERISRVIQMRRDAGHRLGLAEYTHLLACAASMGYGLMASRIWDDMAQDGVEPNVECYNYLMEAKVWDKLYNAKENHRVRSTPWIYAKRNVGWFTPNPGYRGYRTGEGGVRDQVHELFDTMVRGGLNPNEATFIHLMTAAGREWDMNAVKNTLRTVWSIDADLLEEDASSHPQVSVYATSSPLHPTSRLLYAVAHIFGSNNDFATALKLVDFISQSYNLPIPQRVWQELLQWSFVLAVDRFGKDEEQNMLGRIPGDSPFKLFDVLSSPPYNTPVNPRMHDTLIKTGWLRQSQDRTFRHMRAGRESFLETLGSRNQSFHNLLRMHDEITSMQRDGISPENITFSEDDNDCGLRLPSPAYEYRLARLSPSIASPGAYWDLHNTVKLLNTKVARELSYIQRWIRLVLTRRKWHGKKIAWERQGIPQFIEEWREYLPFTVFYHTKTGIVEFDPASLWPEGHRWDLASFMLPLWDEEDRRLLEHHKSTDVELQDLLSELDMAHDDLSRPTPGTV